MIFLYRVGTADFNGEWTTDVRVRVLFCKPTEDDWHDMRALANSLTSDRESVRVFAEEEAEAEWLVAEFRMPTEAQIKAVDKIDRVLRYTVENREDSTIGFLRSAAEEARARRKALRKASRMEK